MIDHLQLCILKAGQGYLDDVHAPKGQSLPRQKHLTPYYFEQASSVFCLLCADCAAQLCSNWPVFIGSSCNSNVVTLWFLMHGTFFKCFFPVFKSIPDKSWVYTLGLCWFPCLEVLRAVKTQNSICTRTNMQPGILLRPWVSGLSSLVFAKL